jgi:hypothetical protein
VTAEMLIHDTMDDETTLAEEEALQTVEEERAELDNLQEVLLFPQTTRMLRSICPSSMLRSCPSSRLRALALCRME